MLLAILILAVAGLALFYGTLLANKLPYRLGRLSASILLALTTCFGFVWGCSALFFGNMYPTITQNISADYFYTQQLYGFATTSSQGYYLVFYQNHSVWFDQELGRIQLECAGKETIAVDIVASHDDINRLTIKADNTIVIDTMLNFKQSFSFKHSTLY